MNDLARLLILSATCLFAAGEFAVAKPQDDAAEKTPTLEWIQTSDDNSHFVGATSGEKIVLWGVNYDHDGDGRLLEDYWADEWDTVVADFAEIKALGANVVRIHLQVAKFLAGPNDPNAEHLAHLSQLVRLAERTGLYLDVTGLGCYHKQDLPAWYDALDEKQRWDAQACFWRSVAKVCKSSPAVFCYDLMNEPILPGRNKVETEWLTGELGGKFFVQRISLDLAGRTRDQVARDWVNHLVSAIREVDDRHMITVGVIPWALTFRGAKPLFYSPTVAESLDFVSVHFYPRSGEVDRALKALKVYDVGKPLIIEEMFPLRCSIEELETFIDASRDCVDGWISFYWGATIEENEKQGSLQGAIIAEWLRKFRSLSPAR
jgi:hypothetical protein